MRCETYYSTHRFFHKFGLIRSSISRGGPFFVLLSEVVVSYFCSMGIMKRQAEAMTNRRSWGQKSNSLGGRAWPIEVSVEGDTGITQRHQRELDKKSVAKLNRQVRAWGQMVNRGLMSNILLRIDKDVQLSSSLKQPTM